MSEFSGGASDFDTESREENFKSSQICIAVFLVAVVEERDLTPLHSPVSSQPYVNTSDAFWWSIITRIQRSDELFHHDEFVRFPTTALGLLNARANAPVDLLVDR